jgi:hypothetical protein
MTNQELMEYWVSNSTYTYLTSGNLSLRHHDLFSYDLKIATRIGDSGQIALILPCAVSTVTTNRHITMAAGAARSSGSISHVFHVPELSLSSEANIAYYEELMNTYAEAALNKRRKYRNRVIACELYIETQRYLTDYVLCTSLPLPEVLTVRSSIFDIIEDRDTSFLGQLALEGDADYLNQLQQEQ